MLPLIVFIIGAIIIIARFVIRISNTKEQNSEAVVNINRTIQQENVTITKQMNYQLVLVQKIHLIVDDENKNIHLFYMNNPEIVIPYSKIMGCEVYQNGTIIGGVKRAIVGGAIAGGAGAIVGALTTGKKEYSIGLKISQNDLQNPEIILPMIDPATDGEAAKDAKLYQEAVNFANEVVATMNVIMQQ